MRLPAQQTCPWLNRMPSWMPSSIMSHLQSGKTMLADLPPNSSVAGMRRSAAARATSRPTSVEPVKRELADTRVVQDVLAGLRTAARDDVEHPWRDDALGELGQLEDRERRGGRRLEHRAVAGGEHGSELPGGHEEREVPRHDLAHDADGLVQHERTSCCRGAGRPSPVVGQKHAGEIAEVVDRVRARRWRASRGWACRCRAFRAARTSRRSPR